MVAAGKDSDFIFLHFVNQTMLFVNPARPATGQLMFQRFRLTGSLKRIYLNLFDQLHDPQGFFRSFSIHHVRSSKADGSNSKLCADIVERNPFFAIFCFQ